MSEIQLKTEKLSKSFSSGGAMQHVLKNIDLQELFIYGTYSLLDRAELFTLYMIFSMSLLKQGMRGVPAVAQWVKNQTAVVQVTMEAQVQFPAWNSGLKDPGLP